MVIAVVDGQGGGIGKAIVEKLRQTFGNELNILALGTNALATSLMIKAGANEGASGENAIVVNAATADILIGSIGIIVANAMLGELTPNMAQAISSTKALKILIPLNRCNIEIAGIKKQPLPHSIDDAMVVLKDYLEGEKHV